MATIALPLDRPMLVELVGPAGVGKSSVAQALRRRGMAGYGTIWGQPVLPLLANGIRLIPSLAALWLDSQSLLWDESRHMVRLRTLHRELQRVQADGEQALVFDEGPVFALAWLRGFGHEALRREVSRSWWTVTLRQWADVMDAVVVLDAPDSLLAQRIKTRPEWHEIKHASDSEITVWIARFRNALDWVLAGLTAHGGPIVIRISTDQDGPKHIAERVVAAIEGITGDD